MNDRTQQHRGLRVERLPMFSTLDANPLTAAPANNTVTPSPDAAEFRVDFPRWLQTRGTAPPSAVLL